MKPGHALAVTALLLCISASPAFADELRLTASDWRPYVDSREQRNGFAIVLVTRALERAGYSVSVEIGPWPQTFDDTVAGKQDVFATLWFTDERAESIVFSDPYLESDIVLIRQSDSTFRYRELEDLRGLRIGVVDDFAYSPESVDTTDIKIESSGSLADNFAHLRGGELDLVLADRRVARSEINERALAKSFDVLPDPLITRGLRIGVSKQRDDADAIVAAFEEEIAKMRDDGSFNAILATFRISE